MLARRRRPAASCLRDAGAVTLRTVAASLDHDPPVGEGAAPAPWSSRKQILFRNLLCHCLLYSLPVPISTFFETMAAGIDYLAWKLEVGWLRDDPFTWPRAVASALGSAYGWWQALTSWLSANGLTPIEVLVQPTGSGDTAHEYVRLACIVAFAILATTAWSLMGRRSRGYPQLGRWLHLFARWYLAFVLLDYGLHKFYLGQFGTANLWLLTQEFGDQSPMGLVWSFMAASKPYELLAAFGEVLGGLLLLHHRTALIGCFVAMGVLANVCALNWLYDVPVKLFSTHLLLYAFFLLAPYRHRLWALFVSNASSGPVDVTVVRRPSAAWMLALFGCSWVVCHLVNTHFANLKMVAAYGVGAPTPELYGVWNVEKMVLDGVEVPATDATRWKFLAIDRGGRAWARAATGKLEWFVCAEDTGGGALNLRIGPQQAGAEHVWTCERGTKTVEQPNPEPRTMADYGTPIQIERRTLVLRGRLGDKQLELHTIERVFPLLRGFRFVQEMPYNR
jgi:hypothetical protein